MDVSFSPNPTDLLDDAPPAQPPMTLATLLELSGELAGLAGVPSRPTCMASPHSDQSAVKQAEWVDTSQVVEASGSPMHLPSTVKEERLSPASVCQIGTESPGEFPSTVQVENKGVAAPIMVSAYKGPHKHGFPLTNQAFLPG